MSAFHPQSEMYHDNPASRSPGSHRQQQQTLHRQSSRQFDVYGQIPTGLYTTDDSLARLDTGRFDRMNTTMHSGTYSYDLSAAQTWNPNAYNGANTMTSLSATGRMRPTIPRRTGLPTTWLDQPQLPSNLGFPGLGPGSLGGVQFRQDGMGQDPDEELIPTAIVIKNIPFAVKKEQLVQLMTDMNLPLPYAFNYHFDNGVFRGLAFANFTSAEETALVIETLNHFELQGRKLRVEYKKMLPLQERERIEREKRERRGQLEEQHRPMGTSQLHNQHSMSSMSSHIPTTSPSPVSQRSMKFDVDLNDPQTLNFYSQILLFKDDMTREAVIFSPNLSPIQRRVVHTLAHHMGLSHVSRGNGDQRQVHVFRPQPGNNSSPPLPQMSSTIFSSDPSRRGLNRAATIDFSEARGSDNMHSNLRGQGSGFLGIPDSPGGLNAQSLRAAKSYADLRSYTPSPVPSSASFPAAIQSNVSRFQDYGPGSASSTTPTLTPTASGSALGNHRDESLLVNGLGSMSIGTSLSGLSNGGSPQRLRSLFSWDQDNGNSISTGGPIGSQRSVSVNMGFDDAARDRSQAMPLRQPRNPPTERGSGFGTRRQNGHQSRDSDELRNGGSGVEIIVE
ncbi:MAG: hypothetical protein M1834_005802 [Cirrosporium novae-zelandiae]|nr:MAG: hypothetical protein M1834_005802 [Cirrosporium novae-zelandiae]